MTDNQMLLSELARVKAFFQLRTITKVIGAPEPQVPLPRDADQEEAHCLLVRE